MEQLLKVMKEKGIAQANLCVVDLHGHPKFMIIPRDHLSEAAAGTGIDGSSLPGFTTVDNSDLLAKPDWKSALFVRGEVVLFCDVEYAHGQQFEGDPRWILKKVLKKGEKVGTFSAKPELEFYLLRENAPYDQEGYMDPCDGLNIVKKAIDNVHIPIERIHHENGPGQYEIEPLTAPALTVCDCIILLKELLREAARDAHAGVTFMPKPFAGVAGSGMHFHILAEKDGRNLFEPFSGLGLPFVGGLLSHARGITAVCNPTINSYKRLVPHFEAPVHISWGRGNRSVLVRIPLGGKTRVEFRSPDPLCNPYLALSLLIGAGLDGVEKNMHPPPEVEGDAFTQKGGGNLLPGTLGEAVEEMEKDALVTEILGEHVVKAFIAAKKEEIRAYGTHISRWEFDRYAAF